MGPYGYEGINIAGNITIAGNNAVFGGNDRLWGSFFCVGCKDDSKNALLSVSHVTFKNGSIGNVPFGFDGGAISVWRGSVTLTSCTFSGNTAMGTGGAIYARSPSTVLLIGCDFQPPISEGRNDIGRDDYPNRSATVTFGCPSGSSGPLVQMQGDEITMIPPKELKCIPGNCFCRDSQCVVDPTATLPCTKCETPGACCPAPPCV
jgi:predicted outer membrane repeat protein